MTPRRLVPVVAAAAVVGVTGAEAMPSWTGQQPVAGALAVAPHVAVNAAGRAIAVWDEERGPDCATAPASLTCVHTLVVRDKPSAGAPWGATAPVARPGVDSRPRVALDAAGDAAVLWVHDIGDDRFVQAVLRDGPAGAWPNPEDVSKEVHTVGAHDVALDDAGDAVALWVQQTSSGSELRVAVRRAALRFWGTAGLLSTGGVTGGASLALAASGQAVAVWIENGVVRAARGDARSDSWTASVPVSRSAGEAVGDPVVAVNGRGDAVAAWQWRDHPGGQLLAQAAYDRAGAGWGPPRDLGASAGTGTPQAAIDANGGGLTAWLEGPAPALRAAAVTAAGEWRPAVTVASRGAAEPQVSVDPTGNAVAAWVDAASATVRASVRPATPRAWQPPATLSHAPASSPRLAIDGTGAAVAVWSQGRGAAAAVAGADLLGDWRPTLALSRRPAIAGRPLLGATLTCRRGAWQGTVPIRFSYAWLRGSAGPIAGATSALYRVGAADRGARLACRVTARNAAGVRSATSQAVRVPG